MVTQNIKAIRKSFVKNKLSVYKKVNIAKTNKLFALNRFYCQTNKFLSLEFINFFKYL